MAKIRTYKDYDEKNHYLYYCLGCGYEHSFGLEKHTWNENFNKPTISPSLLQDWVPNKVCHSFIKEGMIQYLGDCWHHLAGKTVELPEYDQETGKPIL